MIPKKSLLALGSLLELIILKTGKNTEPSFYPAFRVPTELHGQRKRQGAAVKEHSISG